MKKLFSILVTVILGLLLCCKPNAKNPGMSGGVTTSPDSTKIDTQWINAEEFRLVQNGDTIEIYRKTGFDKSYKDFPVNLFKGKKASLDYKSHRIAREYKSVITHHYKQEQVNFAGHYILVDWRCGAPCLDLAIIDVKTGDVYYPEMMNPGNFDFMPDSKLFVLFPPDSLGWYPTIETFSGAPRYYLWENNRLNLIWRDTIQ